ncbi:MAG: VOC family protein, partial [Chloroflexota bacterium]
MAITGLGGTTIWSENINNLLPFYRDTLGLKPGVEGPEFIVFGDQSAPALSIGTHSEVHGKNNDPARHMVGLNVDDVHGEYERLKKAGVDFVDPPTDFGGLTIATLKDPENNYIQLFQWTG